MLDINGSNTFDEFDAFDDFDETNAIDIKEGSEQEGSEQEGSEQEGSEQEGSEQSNNNSSVEETKVKKKEKGVKLGKRNNGDNAEEKRDNLILYLIIDKPVYGILRYLRESGLKVSNMFSNIIDAKDAVLMQTEPTRIVVVDTGTGKFTTTTMRNELIDMLGISDDQNRTTVFYTDSVLKIDTMRSLGKSGKHIDWVNYKSTSIMAAVLLGYGENYVYDLEDSDDAGDVDDSILNFKGLTYRENEVPRYEIHGLSSDAILTNLVNQEDGALPKYAVRL